MALIKVCGLTSAAGVQAAVDAGADALGFVFAESPRRVTARHAAGISQQVPDGVLRVAVMLHPTPADWELVESVFRPDVLQTDAGDFESLAVSPEIERWPVYRQIEGQGEIDIAENGAGPFIYEGAQSGKGAVVDWAVAAQVAARGRMILAGGLTPDNVADAIRAVRPWGVDASSGLEDAPGKKNPRLIAAYVEAAKAAFAEVQA